MSASLTPALRGDDEAHREAQEVLPWLANGRLGGAELERVQSHVKLCAQCRADLAALHTLRGAEPQDAPELDMEGALARLLPQLDAPEPVPAADTAALKPTWRARLAANDPTWLRLALAAQFCAIAVLAMLLARPSGSADAQGGDYRLLGAAPAVQHSLVVTFKADTPEHELRRIVLGSGARIVGGPTATGAWLLGTDQAPATVAARLHAEPAVTLAEPLATQGQP